ncbi:hypothetical protein ACA910_010550 [Epithemia clementina (nom. ined.)]
MAEEEKHSEVGILVDANLGGEQGAAAEAAAKQEAVEEGGGNAGAVDDVTNDNKDKAASSSSSSRAEKDHLISSSAYNEGNTHILHSTRKAAWGVLFIVVFLALLGLTIERIVGKVKDDNDNDLEQQQIQPPSNESLVLDSYYDNDDDPSFPSTTITSNKTNTNTSDTILAPSKQQDAEPSSLYIVSRSQPYKIDYRCMSDEDCALKDVGNCCGSFMKCTNIDFVPDYSKRCPDPSRPDACGWVEIDFCVCLNGKCEGHQEPVRLPPS